MRIGSLFAGIGGFDLGFEKADFDVSWCVEWDKYSQSVLRKRFPKAKIYGDISQVDPTELDNVDVICGGFPCQDLSIAGKRQGLAGERSGLFHEAMRIVRAINPKFVILENVPGLLTSNNGLDFATVLREVGEGWDCQEVGWRVLDSQYFGVPQRRRRVFIVGSSAIGGAEEVLALREELRGNPEQSAAERKDSASDSPSCSGGDDQVWTHVSTVDTIGALQARDYKGVGSQYVGENKVQVFRKSRRARSVHDHETWVEDNVTNTLNIFDSGDTRTTQVVANMLRARRLTPLECERLQGFPDGWTEGQSDSQRFKQLGNAVTVNVSYWLANRIIGFMQNSHEYQ